jgi:hypothetical protein
MQKPDVWSTSGFQCGWFRLINYKVHKDTTKLFSELSRHCQVFVLLIMCNKNINKSYNAKLICKYYEIPNNERVGSAFTIANIAAVININASPKYKAILRCLTGPRSVAFFERAFP